ncbi:hypothetical protein DYB31_010760, partial [Aphanomyces astaci]
EKHCPTSPRDALRKTFRKCDDAAAIPPETSLFTMLVSEKLAHLQALQQRRLDLVDMLMTREATLQALEDHLARIDKELADIGHAPTSDPESGQWERYHPTNAYRSNTKPNTLYPLWEEPFVFTPIESMSTRVCITVMDDKKTADRHEKLGDTSIELRSLLDQKRRVAW